MQVQKIMPLVSIIVPVYNVENYIQECIQSLITQSYSNIEIILVDDGSRDKSGTFCDYYANIDVRIKVIHTQNNGVSHARNIGIAASNGDWITFVDADDTLNPKAIEISLDYIREHIDDIDVLQFGSSGHQLSYSLCTKEEAIKNRKLRNNACASLYRAEIIRRHNIRFIENLRLGEDQLFNYSVIHYCKYCQRIPDELYYYRRIESSSSNNPNYNALLNTLKEINKFPYYKEFRFYIRNLYMAHIFQLINITNGQKDKVFSKLMIKSVFITTPAKEWNLSSKITAIMAWLSPYLAIKSTRFMLKIYKLINK